MWLLAVSLKNGGCTAMKMTTQLAAQLRIIQKFLDAPELQMQQILTFLAVADVSEIPQADLEKLTGVGQSSVSRNVAKLGPGASPREPGYLLMEAYEDPEYRKRKLVRLTPRGKELVKELERFGAHGARASR
jgi:DNA-binding MarR family transcriptional regulator